MHPTALISVDKLAGSVYATSVRFIAECREIAMQVRQVAADFEQIVSLADVGASDRQMAQAVRELMATKSLGVRRQALLYILNRKLPMGPNAFWDAHPQTFVTVLLHYTYAWMFKLWKGQPAIELEHLRWLSESNHPLAERLIALHLCKGAGEYYREFCRVEKLNFAYLEAHGPEAWLPQWARTFFYDTTDPLGDALGASLSVTFRDLWALWDSSGVPENATCRLAFLNDLWGAWEIRHLDEAMLEAKTLVDRMADHLRLADASLSSEQREAWEATRRRFWLPVKDAYAIERHLKSLRLWTKLFQDAPTVKGSLADGLASS